MQDIGYVVVFNCSTFELFVILQMLCRHIINKLRIPYVGVNFTKRYCQSKAAKGSEKEGKNEEPQESPSLGTVARKYAPFREQDSEEILDVHEERLKYTQLYEERELEEIDPFKGLNLESKFLRYFVLY